MRWPRSIDRSNDPRREEQKLTAMRAAFVAAWCAPANLLLSPHASMPLSCLQDTREPLEIHRRRVCVCVRPPRAAHMSAARTPRCVELRVAPVLARRVARHVTHTACGGIYGMGVFLSV